MATPVAIKVDNWKQQFTLTPPDAGGAAVLTVTSQPTSKVKAEGKAIWKSPLTFTISGYMDGTTIDVPASGSTVAPGSMSSSATKVKVENVAPMLLGDSVTVTVLGQKTSGSSTVPAPVSVTVQITDAGQSSVSAT